MSKHPSFGKNLAIHALIMYYHSPEIPKIKDEIEQFEKENGELGQHPFIKKLYMKLQKAEMNNIMIRTILLGLPELKQRLIEEKYRRERTWIAISFSLHTSKPQLNNWHNEILDTVANILKYKVDRDSIYSREKILNMVRLLEQQIEMLNTNYAELVDPEIMNILLQKKRRYSELYEDINIKIESAVGTKKKILLLKMEYPHATSQQIAHLCNQAEGWVSSCLSSYRKDILDSGKYTDLFCVHNEHKSNQSSPVGG